MPNIIAEREAHRKPVFRKIHEPILRMGTCPENENGIFNPATVQNGRLHIYCREENLRRQSVISCYISSDGIHVDEKAGVVLRPGKEGEPDSVGCEDPRGFFDAETGLTYIEYVGHNGVTQVNMLAVSEKPYDFTHFRKLGPLYHDGRPDKDGSPMGRRKSDRKFVNVRRPMDEDEKEGWGMVISVGDDITGPYEDIAEYKPRAEWEGNRVGGSQFVYIPGTGFVGMHHGAFKPNGHWVYSSGLDLFDEEGIMVASAAEPQIEPTTDLEKGGPEGKEISLCTGLEKVVIKGREHLRAYYGAGDHVVMVAEAPLKDCLDYLLSPECTLN